MLLRDIPIIFDADLGHGEVDVESISALPVLMSSKSSWLYMAPGCTLGFNSFLLLIGSEPRRLRLWLFRDSQGSCRFVYVPLSSRTASLNPGFILLVNVGILRQLASANPLSVDLGFTHAVDFGAPRTARTGVYPQGSGNLLLLRTGPGTRTGYSEG